ncbi:hypothetical protein ACHAWO_013006 [Cyclotella atomus]|uniref:Uncharacterized protein n=1 Tax=Cyclotella atomus TaxID=382360 RepID=A0ABD3Q2Z2_9STRA
MPATDFDCDGSPIQTDDSSTTELDVTAMSLPENFDDSLCLDLYKDLSSEGVKPPADAPTRTTCLECKRTSPTHDELEARIRQLLASNLELKEKGRQYDILASRSSEQEAEIQELSQKLNEQSSRYQSCIFREKELQHQILELTRKHQLAQLESEHTMKDVELLTDRCNKAEKDCESNAKALKDLQSKHNDMVSHHAADLEDLKKQTEAEIARVQSESKEEIVLSRKCQEEVFAREAKLLTDAREYAQEQVKSLQQELTSLRSDRACKEVERCDYTTELERQLADVRSDLKIKAVELASLQACHDRVLEETKQMKVESEHTKKELNLLQITHAKLEREAVIERAKLEEIVRQKEDALEIYQHDEWLLQDNDGTTARRKSLVKNSVALAKRCRELQRFLEQATNELSVEREKNEALIKQFNNDKRLYNELITKSNKNASEYILTAMNEREKEISSLKTKVHAMQNDLIDTIKERDDIAAKMAEILERRKNLESMKVLVDEGMKQMRSISVADHADPSSKDSCGKESGPDEDLLQHTVYHRDERYRKS